MLFLYGIAREAHETGPLDAGSAGMVDVLLPLDTGPAALFEHDAAAAPNGAPTQPLGSLRADSPLQIGGTNVPKGMYALYFTIGEDLVWSVNLQNEKDESMVFSWKLSLDTVKKKHSRLRVLLAPAESARNAELEVSFGNMQGALEVARGSEKKAESQPSKTTESN